MWKTNPVRELALVMTGETAAGERSSDAELARLLKLAKGGDASAFERIVIRHERPIFLTALRLLDRVEDAQDASQEVFLRLHKHLRRFDETRQFAPWLYRVTVNVCRDIARKRERDVPLGTELPASSTDPGAGLNRDDQRRIVREALKTLAAKERAAIVLRDLEGLPTKEVARILKSSEATVRSQVSSARLKIKRFAGRLQGER